MNKINYQKELDKLICKLQKENKTPSLLLHVCCAPCSSYCLEYLSQYFRITVLFYNPNISEAAEYEKRKAELIRLIREMPFKNPVSYTDRGYDPKEFYEFVPDRVHDHEGGESCFRCYRLRLLQSAKVAAEGKFDYYTTSLSISPLKNAEKLNEIGGELAAEYGVEYLYSDFKKKNGYKRSIELSNEYGLYRQNFCGCVFSKRERQEEIAEAESKKALE